LRFLRPRKHLVADLNRKMDNPSGSGHLRRHNSVPSRCHLKSYTSLQLGLKSNPYIGSFRHSPPTSFLSILVASHELAYHDSVFPFKISPYPGLFRNQPPSDLERTDDTKRLRCDGPTVAATSLENKHMETKLFDQNTSYSTMRVLGKLSVWLSLPFLNLALVGEEKRCVNEDPIDGKDDNSSTSDDDGRGYYSDDLSLSTLASCDDDIFSLHNRPLEASLSHVAEAYYAHQATQQTDEFSSNEHHLDYVVTQFDIARMARNASKHLDVESILSLPTLTYHCSPSGKCGGGDKIDESWSLVTAPNMDRFTEEVTKDSNICVICMTDYVEGDRLRILPCNHSFHMGCIDRWLSGSHSHLECVTNGCPVCKEKPVLMDSAIEFDGSVPSWAFTQLGGALARSLGAP